MPNQNTFLYPPLTFRILAVAILACLFLVPKTMADTKDQEYIVLISSSTFREKWAYDLLETVEKAFNEENSVKVYSETLTTWHFNNQQEIDQKVDYLKDKYSVPPQAVIFVGDPDGTFVNRFLTPSGEGCLQLFATQCRIRRLI